jgi:hypothetical protein
MSRDIARLFHVDLWVQRKFRQETKVHLAGADAFAQCGKLAIEFLNRHAPIGGHPCRFDLYYGGRRIATSYDVDLADFRSGDNITLRVTFDDWDMR